MKMTLLQMTQNILSAMDGDAVNSISDTVESMQVATTIVETYDELYAGQVNPNMKSLVKLDALGDVANPTFMRIPDTVKSIDWIRYNGKLIRYVEPEEFLNSTFDQTGGMIITDPTFSANFYIYTDADPTTWTTFDGVTVVFNGYDNTADSTLQQSKTVCWGQLNPVFTLADGSYAPFLRADDYPGLLAEAKSVCFINYKQVSNSKSEQQSRRQRVRRQADQWSLNQRKPSSRGNDYGRRGRGS